MADYDYSVYCFKLPNGKVVEICDAVAREAMKNGVRYIGMLTSPMEDGDDDYEITIEGEEEPITVTASTGDIVTYGRKEFVYDGSIWREMGDTSTLGDLAYKNSAQGTYTPEGTISNGTVTLETVYKYVSNSETGGGSCTAGSASAFSATVENDGTLVIDFTPAVPTQVTLPTFTPQNIATGDVTVSGFGFEGTETIIEVH